MGSSVWNYDMIQMVVNPVGEVFIVANSVNKVVLEKLSASGVRQWTAESPEDPNVAYTMYQAGALALDSQGDVLIAGTVLDLSTGSQCPYLAKVTVFGYWLWTRKGNEALVSIQGLVLSANDDAYVAVDDGVMKFPEFSAFSAGWKWAWPDEVLPSTTALAPVADGGVLVAHGSRDKVILTKIDSFGSQQWQMQQEVSIDKEQSRMSSVAGLAVDSAGDILLAGHVQGYFPDTTHRGYTDIYLMKVSAAGTHQWTQQRGSVTHDGCAGIALNAGDDVYVLGVTIGSFDDFVNDDGNDDNGKGSMLMEGIMLMMKFVDAGATTIATTTTATTTVTTTATTIATTTATTTATMTATTAATTATTVQTQAIPTSTSPAVATSVVLVGSLDLSLGSGSIEELLGELKAATEAALASGLASLLDVPQAWIVVVLSARPGRRLQQSSLASAATSVANRRLHAQQAVATYTITMPANITGEDVAETTGSIQEVFLNTGAEQLSSALQGPLSSALGSDFQVQVEAFSVPSIGPISTTQADEDSELSFAAQAVALTTTHTVLLAGLIARALAW